MLRDELPPEGSHHLAQPHLLAPTGGPGSRQVNEVEAGNQQKKHADGPHDVHVVDVAVGFQFRIKLRVQVDGGEGLEE